MSFRDAIDKFIEKYEKFKTEPRPYRGSTIPIIKLSPRLDLEFRLYISSSGDLVRRARVHEIRTRFQPCLKRDDRTGTCPICDLQDEARDLHDPKILSRWRSKSISLSYACVFKHSGQPDRFKDPIPAILVGSETFEFDVMDILRYFDEEQIRTFFDPDKEASLIKLSVKKVDTLEVIILEDKRERMPQLPASAAPLDKVWFEDGSEISEKDLQFARSVLMKPGKNSRVVVKSVPQSQPEVSTVS